MSDDSVALRQAKRADLARLKEIARGRARAARLRGARQDHDADPRDIASSPDRPKTRGRDRRSALAYFPQFHTAPIGVCVQHGPTRAPKRSLEKRPL